jgi:hypothetical protein
MILLLTLANALSAVNTHQVRFTVPVPVAAETVWVRDNRGCSFRFFDRGLRPGEDVETTVPCVKGKLTGEGTVVLRDRGTPIWGRSFRRSGGVYLEAGQPAVDIQSNRWRFISKCDAPYTSYLLVLTPDTLLLENYTVFLRAMTAAHDIARQKCPAAIRPDGVHGSDGADDDGSKVFFAVDNSAVPASAQFDEVYGFGARYQVMYFGSCPLMRALDRCFNYDQYNSRRVASGQWIGQLATERATRISNARARELAQAEAQAPLQRQARLKRLTSQFGSFQLVPLSAVAPNPFVWKGKQIGACVEFQQMIDASTALVQGGLTQNYGFSRAAVTNTPSTRFNHQGVVFLIARVEGQQSGTMVLRFVTAVDQAYDDCRDYLSPN